MINKLSEYLDFRLGHLRERTGDGATFARIDELEAIKKQIDNDSASRTEDEIVVLSDIGESAETIAKQVGQSVESVIAVINGEAESAPQNSQSELRLIQLELQKDDVKKFYEDYKAAVAAVVAEHGLNHYFQDADGIVYKTVEPDGRFVQFDKLAVVRTRRAGEKAGSLSLKEAKEAGFEVENKEK